MSTINQCRVRQTGPETWYRVEWLPTKDAVVGNSVTVDGVLVRGGKVFKDNAVYRVETVYLPAMPEDLFKKQEQKK